jgi:hypothetical protein
MIMNKKKISILLFGLAICSIFILFSPQEVEAIGRYMWNIGL